MIGVEPHRCADALDAFVRLALGGQGDADAGDGVGIVRIEFDRALIVAGFVLDVSTMTVHGPQQPMAMTIVAVRLDGRMPGGERRLPHVFGRPPVTMSDDPAEGEIDLRHVIIRIQLHRLPE